MIRVIIKRSYYEIPFIFTDMETAGKFIEIAMKTAEEDLSFVVERVEGNGDE